MKILIILLTFICFLFSENNILKESKKEYFKLNEENIILKNDILKNEWISPLDLSVGRYKDSVNSNLNDKFDSTNFKISINQDIFRSGGIFYAINYAKAQKDFQLKDLNFEKNYQIVLAYSLLMQLKKLNLSIKKQELLIESSVLDIKKKKEQYLAGLLDISFLNDTILTKTNLEDSLIDFQSQKEDLLLEFKKLSDKDYESIVLPMLFLPQKEDFFENNLLVKKQDSLLEGKKYFSKMVKTKYLPKLTFSASHTTSNSKINHLKNNDSYQSYGLTLSMPLHINSLKDIESSKVDILIANNEKKLINEDLLQQYNKAQNEIKRIDKKINLTQKNIEIYDTLFKQAKELFDAQMNSIEDLKIVELSRKTKILDKQIYEIQRLEKILDLYNNFMLVW